MPLYLDAAATTPVDPRVLEAMLPYFSEIFGNASSQHIYGQQAKAAVEKAREQVASIVNVEPSEIIFTSGATEAINLAIKGIGRPTETEATTSSPSKPSTRPSLPHTNTSKLLALKSPTST